LEGKLKKAQKAEKELQAQLEQAKQAQPSEK
jgi:hypothetical protein